MKRILYLGFITLFVLVGTVSAKQWDQYTDFAEFPAPSDTLLIYDVSEGTASEQIKEVSLTYLFGALELKPVWVDLAGTSIYTIDQSAGNMFYINTVGATGDTGVSIFLPNLGSGTSQYANRPYWIVDNTISGTTPLWLVPQFNNSQTTQWAVSTDGVVTSQSGTSNIANNNMDARMDSVMIIPRYVSATGGVTHYIHEFVN